MFDKITLAHVTPDLWNKEPTQCHQFIQDDSVWHSIPLLNYVHPQNLRDYQLVRYIGMIQDMQNPEFYLSRYEVKNKTSEETSVRSGRFRDTIICGENERFVEDSPMNENSERQTWLCVPVPAINEWVAVSWKKPQLKRHSGKIPEDAHEPAKRPVIEVGGPEEQPSTSANTQLPTLPEPHLRTCYLKLYNADEKSYSLNDVVEVTGFVSFDQGLEGDPENEDLMEVDIPEPGVPRLHVVAIKNFSGSKCLLPESVREVVGSAEVVRKDLHLLLSQLLIGDSLAADYLLCHLISAIYSRTDMMALGQLPLNIMNVPKSATYPTEFYKVLELLVTKSNFMPLTLDNLNKKRFIPQKDYQKNQLCGGILQLSSNTHLVLDETQMQPGKLEAAGIINLSALKKLALEQKVAYDFDYYKLDFNADVPVLIFSEGKSMIPCSAVVPLQPDASCVETLPEIFQAVRHFLQPAMLNSVRAFLSHCRCAPFNVSTEMQEIIQEDFVKMRQDKEINATADDLHNLMVLSRLMCLSMGLEKLTPETWRRTLDMETQRKQRLAAANISHA